MDRREAFSNVGTFVVRPKRSEGSGMRSMTDDAQMTREDTGIIAQLKELFRYRDLLWMLTRRDISIRYKQSVMGFLWAILMPLLIVGAGILVRFAYSMSSGQHLNMADLASVALKALPWAFFVSALKFGTSSLVGNSNLVTKIYFPREVFPIAAVLASLFDASIASGVIILVLILAKVGVSIHLLWMPVLLLLTIILTAGLAMFLSCANLFFRDVKYLVDVFLTFGIFFTPVFYEARMFHKWAPLLLVNPIAVLLEAMNDVVVRRQAPSYPWLAYAAFFAVGGLIVSWLIFDRAEAKFAENI
jgi:lipopolysaccharide transport system permease protein